MTELAWQKRGLCRNWAEKLVLILYAVATSQLDYPKALSERLHLKMRRKPQVVQNVLLCCCLGPRHGAYYTSFVRAVLDSCSLQCQIQGADLDPLKP